jgi:hypothetical protein
MLSLVTSAALVSSSLAASSAKTISRRRSEFAWYLASALLGRHRRRGDRVTERRLTAFSQAGSE